jgi:hypothetical protein
MDGAAQAAGGGNDVALSNIGNSPDFGFLPQNLRTQCRSLIESYHGLHGFGSLPDILWKAGLGPFIETHREFRLLLRKASTTRSAKKSSEGFTQIATTLLSLEILAGNFAGWGTIYPHAASTAKSILKRHTRLSHMPLMESYLYPPKHISSAAIVTLTPPAGRDTPESGPLKPPRPQSEHQANSLPVDEMSELATSSLRG